MNSESDWLSSNLLDLMLCRSTARPLRQWALQDEANIQKSVPEGEDAHAELEAIALQLALAKSL